MTKTKGKNVKKGRRYSPGEKEQILADAEELGVAAAVAKHGCSGWSVHRWRQQREREAERAALVATESSPVAPAPLAGAEDAQPESDGEPGPSSVSTQEERQRLILAMWREQPGLGPSQIRNQLKRKGFKASVSTVRSIMEEHGYVQPRLERKEVTESYEAVRPRQLYHLDFAHFFVHRQPQRMLLIEDDFSRFIPGWTLLESEHADGVIAAFEESIARYGKPEGVMSDGGSAFHSWKGMARFQRLLEEHSIDFYLAREPRKNGKVERLVEAYKKELVRQVEFADLDDAARQTARWVQFYNYRRTHHSLGGLLVPADRFHGFADETLARIERGHGAELDDLMDPAARELELFRVVSVRGNAQVYLMGRKLLG